MSSSSSVALEKEAKMAVSPSIMNRISPDFDTILNEHVTLTEENTCRFLLVVSRKA